MEKMNSKPRKFPIEGSKSESVCYGVGKSKAGGDGCIYKYLTINSALLCLCSKNIMFQEPLCWRDKYESRFYTADYNRLNLYNTHPEWINKVYACCFTTTSQNEAAWKIYADMFGANDSCRYCVQIKIRRTALRKFLNTYAQQNDMKEYEGRVTYMEPFVINHLHEQQLTDKNGAKYYNPDHQTWFTSFSLGRYLQLLLLKRKAFTHESELRFFLMPKQVEEKNKGGREKVFPKIEWKDIIEEIRVDSSTPDYLYKYFLSKCSQVGLKKCLISKYDVYDMTGNTITIEP